MAWVEKRLRGARVWMQTDEAGQPLGGADNRVEIVYRPGGKPYRAAVKNLEDLPGAKPLSDDELMQQAPPERASAATPSRGATAGPGAADDAVTGAAGPSRTAVSLAHAHRPPRDEDAIHVYTDGACTGNPGPMGIGVVILDPTAKNGSARRELSSYLGQGTNNIAELTAIQRGLEPLPRDRPVIIYSDSSYSIGVLAQGWRAKANQDLVAGLRRLLGEFRRVTFVKVAGHAGVPENERCDELARQAIVRRQP